MENTEKNVMKPMSPVRILKHLVVHGMRPTSIVAALKYLPDPHNELRRRVINNMHKDTDEPFFDDDDGAKENLACLVALSRAVIFDSQALRRKALLASFPPPPKREAELRTLGFSDWEIESFMETLEKLENPPANW